MSDRLKDLRVIKAAIDRNGGKPIPENKTPNVTSLLRRGYLNRGNSNRGSIVWLTNKALNELEDAAE